MEQLDRRLTGEKVLLGGYCQGMWDRATVEEVLEIGRNMMKSESDWAPVTCTAYLQSD